MNRRGAVKNLLVGYGGLIAIPFWMEACGISDKNIHATSFSTVEQDMLAKIADAIIPAGNSIGALSVGVDKYLQKIIDECYEKPVQDNVKKQLQTLDTSARTAYGNAFTGCTSRQREELLMKCSDSRKKEEKDFFDLIKSETIRGFNTSQKVMQDYFDYQVAPGHYYGCIHVKA